MHTTQQTHTQTETASSDSKDSETSTVALPGIYQLLQDPSTITRVYTPHGTTSASEESTRMSVVATATDGTTVLASEQSVMITASPVIVQTKGVTHKQSSSSTESNAIQSTSVTSPEARVSDLVQSEQTGKSLQKHTDAEIGLCTQDCLADKSEQVDSVRSSSASSQEYGRDSLTDSEESDIVKKQKVA